MFMAAVVQSNISLHLREHITDKRMSRMQIKDIIAILPNPPSMFISEVSCI